MLQGNDALSRIELSMIVGLGIIIFAFGWIVLNRSAFLQNRHTDAGVYFRAAWAVQSGTSIYQAKDDNGWPYVSTPFLAILLTPLGDPPAGTPPEKRGYSLPYPASIAVYYAISVAALFGAMHILASAIEGQSGGPNSRVPQRYGRQWWALRLAPILIGAPMLGATLSRGQPTTLILLCLAAMTAAFMRGRSASAGWWLAAAICIKVFPAYLLLYPLWRRDVRCLTTCSAGVLLGLCVLPAAIMGPATTIASYQEYFQLFLLPAFTGADNMSVPDGPWDEIHGHIQSFKAVLFGIVNFFSAETFTVIPRIFWIVHLALSGVMTIVALLAAGKWKRPFDSPDDADVGLRSLLFAGILSTGVLPMIPASRDHYFALGTILLIGLVAMAWKRYGPLRLSTGWVALFGAIFALQIAVQVPRLISVGDIGNVIWAELILWSAGVYQLWKLTGPLQKGGYPQKFRKVLNDIRLWLTLCSYVGRLSMPAMGHFEK